MPIFNTSVITQLGTVTGVSGPVGATGPRGNTGIDGSGLTGNTGISVVGVSLENRYIITSFSDGTTYGTPSQAYGKTGSFNYIIDFNNIGNGVSLADRVESNILYLRPIKVIDNSFFNVKAAQTTVGSPSQSIPPYQISNKFTFDNSPTIPGLSLTYYTWPPESSGNIKYKNNILKFNNQNKLARVANFKRLDYVLYYGDTGRVNSLNLNAANLFERVRGMGWTGSTLSVDCIETSSGITCTIDAFVKEYDAHMYGSTSKIFVADFKGKTGSIIINRPAYSRAGRASGFEIYIFNCKNPDSLDDRITSPFLPILWPFNKPPCFSVGGITCDISISFFEVDSTYYATATALNAGCTGATLFYNNCTNPDTKILKGKSIFNGSEYGACCKSDGSCVEILGTLCDGYFHGNGTTCGSTFASICDKTGACCYDDNKGNKFCSETTSWECVGAGALNGQYNTNFSGNNTKCENIDCDFILQDKGACCNGKGSCYETTKDICTTNNGFFQGKNTTCNLLGDFVCMTGTGPCCIDGNCFIDNANSCFNQNGYFLGSGGITCGDIPCPASVSCLGIVDGIKIYPGQEYGGGYVVGTFIPGVSNILGCKELFHPFGVLGVTGATAFNSTLFKSFLDHSAYGITKQNCHDDQSYIIIIYPEDVYSKYKQYNTYSWGGTGSSWGPLVNDNGNDIDFDNSLSYAQTHIQYGEGYWGITNSSDITSQEIKIKTFTGCSSSKLYGNSGYLRAFGKTPKGLHGLWSQSWGLYNTIRAINAGRAYNKKSTYAPFYIYKDFIGLTGETAFTVIRKTLSDGITSSTQGITGNSAYISGWYLPSHDELAFIAASAASYNNFNINNHLLLHNAEPLNGIYWTSTGSFDYSKNEGIYTNNKPNPGSVAIAMEIDINNKINKIYKKNRQEKCKVRPIRMIRCDKTIPINDNIWNIPSP